MRAQLAGLMLEALNRTDISVYAGIGRPILQSLSDHEKELTDRPGQMAMLERRRPSVKPQRGRAVDFIIDTVMEGNGDITLVPIGPLTNVAAAFIAEPRLAQKASICMMGGATDRPGPEWNALCDPEATRVVFSAGAPITMVGLDVTTRCVMTYDQVKAVGAVDRPINQMLFELVHLWGEGDPTPRPILHVYVVKTSGTKGEPLKRATWTLTGSGSSQICQLPFG